MKRIAVFLYLLPAAMGQARQSGTTNPPIAAMIPDGASLYKSHCASCHGEDGRGRGTVAENLALKSVDLTQLSVKNGGEFPLRRLQRMLGGEELVRGHGTRQMPVWGAGLDLGKPGSPESQARIERVIGHLRKMQAKPAAGK